MKTITTLILLVLLTSCNSINQLLNTKIEINGWATNIQDQPIKALHDSKFYICLNLKLVNKQDPNFWQKISKCQKTHIANGNFQNTFKFNSLKEIMGDSTIMESDITSLSMLTVEVPFELVEEADKVLDNTLISVPENLKARNISDAFKQLANSNVSAVGMALISPMVGIPLGIYKFIKGDIFTVNGGEDGRRVDNRVMLQHPSVVANEFIFTRTQAQGLQTKVEKLNAIQAQILVKFDHDDHTVFIKEDGRFVSPFKYPVKNRPAVESIIQFN